MNNCLSPHLPEPQPNHARLTWFTARPEQRRRIIAWTCHCDPVIYELCTAGGQFFLLRTDLAAKEVRETRRMRLREGQAVWQALLQGRAR